MFLAKISSYFRSVITRFLALPWWGAFEALGIISSVLSIIGIYLAWQSLSDQRAANRVSLIVKSWDLVNKAVDARSYSDTGHFAAVEYLGREGLLQGAKLENIVLTRVTPGGYKGVFLSGADLKGANLSGASLQGADLSNADLRYASLVGAKLAGANLTGAQLDETDMRGATYETIARFKKGDYFEFPTAQVSDAQLKEACHVGFEVTSRYSQSAQYVSSSNSCDLVQSNIARKITPEPKRDLVQELFGQECKTMWGEKIKDSANCPDHFWPPGIADPD